jgi:hypothetical protein
MLCLYSGEDAADEAADVGGCERTDRDEAMPLPVAGCLVERRDRVELWRAGAAFIEVEVLTMSSLSGRAASDSATN